MLFKKFKIDYSSGSTVKVSNSLFFCMSKSRTTKHIETKVLNTCFYFIWSFFKNKKRSGTNFPALFSACFLKKNITRVLHCLIVFTFYLSGNMFIVTVCVLASDIKNFDCLITRCFPAQPKKLGKRCKYLKKEKNIHYC